MAYGIKFSIHLSNVLIMLLLWAASAIKHWLKVAAFLESVAEDGAKQLLGIHLTLVAVSARVSEAWLAAARWLVSRIACCAKSVILLTFALISQDLFPN